VEHLAIINAVESRVDGVIFLGFPDGKCHLLDGNKRARRIVNYTKGLLEEIGIESDRLEMYQLGTPEWQGFDQVFETMIHRIDAEKIPH